MELFWTLLYIVLVFEKSRQFCANIFGNTMWRSFLKKGNFYSWCRTNFSSYWKTRSHANKFELLTTSHLTERHCRRHCQQQRSREECSRRGCPRQSPMDFPVSSVQFINFMFGWMSCKEIKYRLWKLVNDVPDGVDRGVCMGWCSVPRSVQIGSFRWILSISILTVLTVYQQHINRV